MTGISPDPTVSYTSSPSNPAKHEAFMYSFTPPSTPGPTPAPRTSRKRRRQCPECD
ncbi:hypothetical protein FRC07_010263, partial [Ceratobasidium sp. 392]